MRFSLNFVKEFLPVEKTPQEIAEMLTAIGMEVEHLERRGNDWIFDIEVTPNRYDWLSILGVVRELACIWGRKLNLKTPSVIKKPLLKEKDILIEDKNDCSFYVARVVRDIEVKPSQGWLEERIDHCGINSVNNIVDITNYCMLKWGNPLHAFDLDEIEGNIYVRRAKKGEVFVGLDDKERVLGEDNLVIADERKVIALAGVIGGKNTAVTFKTKNILLEAAIFSPLTIRLSRRKAGIETQSSYRFERGVSPQFLEFASQETQNLIINLAGGRFGGYKEKGRIPSRQKKKIIFSSSRLNEYVGEEISYSKIKKILTNLEFKVEEGSGGKMVVSPPRFRLDIEREVDVFEEILRFYGYDQVKPSIPFISPQLGTEKSYTFKKKLRSFLKGLGLKEVITTSFTGEDVLRELKEDNYIKIKDPLNKQENALRPTLLCGAIKGVTYNLNQAMTSLRFFEIANIYRKKVFCKGDSGEFPFEEIPALAIMITDKENKIFYLKGLVERVLKFLNVEDYCFKECTYPAFFNALMVTSNNNKIGFLGKLDRKIKEKVGLKEDLYFAQLDINILEKVREEYTYRGFSRYPGIYRDISIALKKDKKFKDLEEIIRNNTHSLLSDYEVIDIYKGEKCPLDSIVFTLRLFYCSPQRTLTSQEVDVVHNHLREVLSAVEGVVLR
ncbi:MAG: phenylalanine--tRNA ligase subunit beta [Candidatus Omnitrophica bacterium 4484_70.2]|nr:MAG: phenylalanine--tRNA ligase subunit beta [Candidatus Omnitrophica bacterium 4484_70.2]